MSRLGSALNRSMGGGGGSADPAPVAAPLAGAPASRVQRKRGRDDPGSPTSDAVGSGSTSGGAAAAASTTSTSAAKPSQVIVPVPVPVAWVGDRIGTSHYGAAYFGSRVYHVNDTVLLQSGNNVPFVCRIERMLERDGHKLMYVRWFFRAPDVPDVVGLLKRQPYCEELFMTDVVEENEVATIVSRCYILTPQKYARLPRHLRESNVFCCSLFYDSVRERFSPVQSIGVAGLFLSDPPEKAPRLNMPDFQHALLTFGVAGLGGPRGPGRGRKRVQAPDASASKAGIVCCVEYCENLCWTKRPKTSLVCEWSMKPSGSSYVCADHYNADRQLGEKGVKRSRSLCSSPAASDDESDVRVPAAAAVARRTHRARESTTGGDDDLASDQPSRRRRARSVDLDPAPVRESTRLSVHHRKNALCTRGVVVYLKDVASVDNIVGEIIVHPKTTLAEVRHMIRDELGLAAAFVLRKNTIPLPRNQDNKLACWFFSASDDVLIVVPEATSTQASSAVDSVGHPASAATTIASGDSDSDDSNNSGAAADSSNE